MTDNDQRDQPIALDYAPRGLKSPRSRLNVWIELSAGILVITFAWLWSLATCEPRDEKDVLALGWAAVAAALCGIAWLLKTTIPNAIRIPPTQSVITILITSALMHGAAVWMLAPSLSEDVARYCSDGRAWLVGKSPYAHNPLDLWSFYPEPAVIATILDPHVASVHPPVAHVTFVVARALERVIPAGTSPQAVQRSVVYQRMVRAFARHPSILSFRILYALCAMIATMVLISILYQRNESVWWSVLFAWHPLAIIDTGANPHVDVVGIVFVLLTIFMLLNNRALVAAIMFAIVCGVKPQAAILLPWLLRDIYRDNPCDSRRQVTHALGGFAITSAIIYIPSLAYQHGYRGCLDALKHHLAQPAFNGALYELLRQSNNARTVQLGAIVLTAVLLWRSRATFVEAGYWLFLIALLCVPVVYPWHLLWILCFVPLIRGPHGWTGLIWCATVGVSYQVWDEPQWRLPTRFILLEYLPVYIALVTEVYRTIRKGSMRAATSASGAPIFQ